MYNNSLVIGTYTHLRLVYPPDLGSGAARCEGSSPFIRTINYALKLSKNSLKYELTILLIQSILFLSFQWVSV